MPDEILGFLRSARDRAPADFPGYISTLPTDEELVDQIGNATRANDFDRFLSIVLTSTGKGRSVGIRVTRENELGVFDVGSFRDPRDLDGTNARTLSYKTDGDVFSEKSTTITPMIRTSRGSLKVWGRSVLVTSVNTNSESPFTRITDEDSRRGVRRAPFTRKARVTFKSATRAMIRSGRLYVRLTVSCKLREPFHVYVDPGVFKRRCARGGGSDAFRVKPGMSRYTPGSGEQDDIVRAEALVVSSGSETR